MSGQRGVQGTSRVNNGASSPSSPCSPKCFRVFVPLISSLRFLACFLESASVVQLSCVFSLSRISSVSSFFRLSCTQRERDRATVGLGASEMGGVRTCAHGYHSHTLIALHAGWIDLPQPRGTHGCPRPGRDSTHGP